MVFRILADAVVLLHLAFVSFVVLGGLLALRWPRAAWAHIPAAIWGAWVELAGWVCPLTPIENRLRIRGGAEAYGSGFVEHYLVPLLYPASLPRGTQWWLGVSVVVLNAAIYATILRRRARRRPRPGNGTGGNV